MSSLPGLTRQSIVKKDSLLMDARVKPAHDKLKVVAARVARGKLNYEIELVRRRRRCMVPTFGNPRLRSCKERYANFGKCGHQPYS
jgi:hypothetical protein